MMLQTTFPVIKIAIILAAILSLSTIATAFADDGGTDGKSKSSPSGDDSGTHRPQKQEQKQNQKVGTIPDYRKCSSGSSCASIARDDNNNNNNGGNEGGSAGNGDNFIDHKIKTINRLFRGNSNNNGDTGQSALDNIPVIQPLTPAQLNGTNATATVTIPVCDGIVSGPCLDKTTGQIVP
jgi:hypothetical protein